MDNVVAENERLMKEWQAKNNANIQPSAKLTPPVPLNTTKIASGYASASSTPVLATHLHTTLTEKAKIDDESKKSKLIAIAEAEAFLDHKKEKTNWRNRRTRQNGIAFKPRLVLKRCEKFDPDDGR